MTMTATEAMKSELHRVQEAQAECVTEWGAIKPECRYRYQILTRKAAELKGSIDWMNDLYHPAGQLVADPRKP